LRALEKTCASLLRKMFLCLPAGADNEAVKNVTMWRAAVVIIKPRRKRSYTQEITAHLTHTHGRRE
jgi:hypothetical protein